MAKDLSIVHPDLRRTAKIFPHLPFRRWNLRFIRWLSKFQPRAKRPSDVLLDKVTIQSQNPEQKVRLRIYKPLQGSTTSPALVWMHGGGFIIGRPEQNDRYLFQLTQQLAMVIISVDYRLSPEYPFPTPLEDCYSALKWAHDHVNLLKIDPRRIAIGGESAGGGLAASLAQLAHARGEVRPIFQLLVYPMLDDRTTLREGVTNADLMTWTIENNRLGWEAYLNQPCGASTAAEFAVPSRRIDLTGLPPAWIGVGTLDLFHDENVAYAQALRNCGVDCDVLVIPGAFHGFDQFDHSLSVVQDFHQAQIRALKRHLFSERAASGPMQ